MNPVLATAGNLQIDSVITANGQVGLNFAGGNGGYSAVGARLWAGECMLIAQMPENFPAKWLNELSKGGVSTERVTSIAGFRPESSEWFLYDADGNRRDFLFASVPDLVPYGYNFPSEPGTPLSLSPEELVRMKDAVLRASGGRPEPRPVFNLTERVQQILSDTSNIQAIHLAPSSYDMHLALVRALGAQKKIISLDPGHYVKGLDPARIEELLEHVTIFAPSEREVYEFRGECDLEQAANDFSALGPQVVVIKVGPRGALVLRRETSTLERVPAFPSRTLDPTGCGDSFCGGFLAGYWETRDALQAARYGTVSASYTVEGFGVNYALRFTRADAEQRLAILERDSSAA